MSENARQRLDAVVEELAKEHPDGEVEDALAAVLDDVRDKRLKGEPLVAVSIDDHTFDGEERRMLVERDGVLMDQQGHNARQAIQGEVTLDALKDGRLVLGGDTYEAKDHIKAVDYQAREFDGDRKAWLVDADHLDELHRHLNGGGFLFTDARDAEAEPSEAERREESLDRLGELVDLFDEGDRIQVGYEMKNGNGVNTKEGEITEVRLPDEEYRDEPQLVFDRDDDQRMYVEVDDQGKLGLWTSMSHAPFVGEVVEVSRAPEVEA